MDESRPNGMNTPHARDDYTLSVEVAVVIGAERYRCWRNAALAVLLLPELFHLGTYIEGWVVVPRQRVIEIIEHGWCKTPDQRIVDPTITLIVDLPPG